MSMTLLLVRPTQTTWNQENRFRGRANVPLDGVGFAQAEATAQYIRSHWSPRAIYCSPLPRARQTAEVISAPFTLHERTHPGFLDISFGAWEGLTEIEVAERWKQALAAWYAEPHNAPIPGGEPLETVRLRTMGAMNEIMNRHEKDVIVVVGHAAVNRIILLSAFNIGLERYWHFGQDLGAINVLELKERYFTLHMMNYTGHLENR